MSVAIIALPQSMAYAVIAEVPPVYGLYTFILQTILGAAFSSHPVLGLGPVNSQSLVVASIATRLQSPGDVTAYLTLVVTLTLMKGVLQLCMAGLRLGYLTRYVSRSVIVGFTAGAGVLIAAKQVGPFLGFATPRMEGDWPGLVGIVQQIIRGAAETDPRALALGVFAVAVMAGCRAASRAIPGSLIAVVAGGVIVAWMGWTGDDLPLLGALPLLPPTWALPQIDGATLERLLPAGLALAVLGAIETHAIAKSLKPIAGHAVDSNRDMFGQGLSGAVTALLCCIPGSASLSRSALCQAAGGMTMFANLIAAGLVTLSLVLFSDAARTVPMAAIAGILLWIAWGLIDWRYARRVLRTDRGDASVLAATMIATLTIPLEYAVLVGVSLSIGLYLHRTSTLQMRQMVPTDSGAFVERSMEAWADDQAESNAVVFIQLEGSLFFAQAEEFEHQLRRVARGPARVVLFRLRRTHSIDPTMLGVLERFTRQLADQGRHVVLCGVHPALLEILDDFRLSTAIGSENIFVTRKGVFASAESAYRRATELSRQGAAGGSEASSRGAPTGGGNDGDDDRGDEVRANDGGG